MTPERFKVALDGLFGAVTDYIKRSTLPQIQALQRRVDALEAAQRKGDAERVEGAARSWVQK